MIPKEALAERGHVRPGLLQGNQQPAEAAPSPLRISIGSRLACIDVGRPVEDGRGPSVMRFLRPLHYDAQTPLTAMAERKSKHESFLPQCCGRALCSF